MMQLTTSRKSLLILISALNFAGAEPGDLHLNFNSYAGQMDNIFNSYLGANQNFVSGSMALANQVSDNSRIYGDIYNRTVTTNPDYSSFSAVAGVQFRNLSLTDQQVFAGLSVSTDVYSTIYDYYNSVTTSGYATWKHFFRPGRSLAFDIAIFRNDYANMTQAANMEYLADGKLHFSRPGGMTLILTGNLARQVFLPEPQLEVPASNTIAVITGQVSRNIGRLVGFSLEARTSQRLNRDQSLLPIMVRIESPFVDEYRRDEMALSAGVTFQLPAGFDLSLRSQYQTQYYLDVPVYEFDFTTGTYVLHDEDYVILSDHRQDRYRYFGVRLFREWPAVYFPVMLGLGTSIQLGWATNQSNDPIYDYSGFNFSLGIHLTN